MSKTVFNKDKIDFTKEPMFFGQAQNTQQYDRVTTKGAGQPPSRIKRVL
jgi:hypothetical protein